MNPTFDYNNLYNKAKRYVQLALAEKRDGDTFPFWLSLSLELLARSALAKINPMLLADSKDELSLIYASGYPVTQDPKSIPISLVFGRLEKINIDFTSSDSSKCKLIANERNAELHSGLRGFETYPASLWLVEYYRICKKILFMLGLGLDDFLGSEESHAAEIMIDSDDKEIKKATCELVSSYKKIFLSLSEAEKSEKIKNSVNANKVGLRNNSKNTKCPSCDFDALIFGELVSISEPKLNDDVIEKETRYLPNQFICNTCGLKMEGYPKLLAVNLSGQFTVTEELDPVDYHNIDIRDYINNSELAELAAEMYAEYQDD